MDDRYPVILKLSKEEYDGMKKIVSAYTGDPVISISAFRIDNSLYNIVCDLVFHGRAERNGLVR